VDTHPHLFGYWQQFIADHRNAYPAIRQELEHIEVAIQSLSHRKEGHILGQILYDMGPLYIAWGDLQKIEGLLIQAIALIEPTKTILLGKLKLRLGQLKRHQMQYDQAEAHLRKGLALTENMGNNALKLQFLTEIGIVYNCKGQYSKGKHYLGQALAISQQESVGEPILTLFEELGTLAILENEAELAEKYQREGLALAVKLDQKINQVLFLKSLGALHHLNKKPADAAALFEQGLQIYREIEYKKGEMLVYNNLGVVAFYNNEMVTAERHLRLSLDRSKKIHEYQAMRLILRNLAKWARQNGRLSQSKRYFEQLHALAEAQGWDDLATKVQGEIKQLSSGEKTPKSEHLRVFI
ncbi:MAG: tetratricopeptide repeat protein, partial [Chloroflexota bacterium]